MAIATFDGPNKRIMLTPPLGESTTSVLVGADLYSDWKEWVCLSDNSKYDMAMRATGGDDLGGGQKMGSYFFVQNQLGWKITPEHENADLHVLELVGNLFPEDPNQGMFEFVQGTNVVVTMTRSVLTMVVTTGGTALTLDEHNRLMALPQTTLETDEREALLAVDGSFVDLTSQIADVDAEVVVVAGAVEAIQAKTDQLPGSIGRARALGHFHVLMVQSADHRTPAEGLVVSADIARDGGAFTAFGGTVAEIGGGIYDVRGWTATDTDCESGTLRLTATGADTRYLSFVTSP